MLSMTVVDTESANRRPDVLASHTEQAEQNVKGTLYQVLFHERQACDDTNYKKPTSFDDIAVVRGEIVLYDASRGSARSHAGSNPSNPIIPAFTSLNGMSRSQIWSVLGVSQANCSVAMKQKERFAVQTDGSATTHARGPYTFEPEDFVMVYLPRQHELEPHTFPRDSPNKILPFVKPLRAGWMWLLLNQIAVEIHTSETKNAERLIAEIERFIEEHDMSLVRSDQWCPFKAYARLMVYELKDIPPNGRDDFPPVLPKEAIAFATTLNDAVAERVSDLEHGFGAYSRTVNANQAIDPARMTRTETAAFIINMANSVATQRILGKAIDGATPNQILHVNILVKQSA